MTMTKKVEYILRILIYAYYEIYYIEAMGKLMVERLIIIMLFDYNLLLFVIRIIQLLHTNGISVLYGICFNDNNTIYSHQIVLWLKSPARKVCQL